MKKDKFDYRKSGMTAINTIIVFTPLLAIEQCVFEGSMPNYYSTNQKQEYVQPTEKVDSSVTDLESFVKEAHLEDDITKKIQVEEPLRVIKYDSPSFIGTNGRRIDTIVLHTTEGTGTSALNTFQNPASKVSVHYLVMENGSIYSLVDEDSIAWHCRNFNNNSIGIEIAGYHNIDLCDKQIRSTQKLIKGIIGRYGLTKNSIKAHSELDPGRRKDPGDANMARILGSIE